MKKAGYWKSSINTRGNLESRGLSSKNITQLFKNFDDTTPWVIILIINDMHNIATNLLLISPFSLRACSYSNALLIACVGNGHVQIIYVDIQPSNAPYSSLYRVCTHQCPTAACCWYAYLALSWSMSQATVTRLARWKANMEKRWNSHTTPPSAGGSCNYSPGEAGTLTWARSVVRTRVLSFSDV